VILSLAPARAGSFDVIYLARGWGMSLHFLCDFFLLIIKINMEIKNYIIMGIRSLMKLLPMDLGPRLHIPLQ